MSVLMFLICMSILCICELGIIFVKKRNAKRANYQCEVCGNWDCSSHNCRKNRINK